ncbi:MAG: cysteine desulfurase [Spirochaetaceae bacterium]|nr:cysteine desulfurase [Spirochaetaceae bacterium]
MTEEKDKINGLSIKERYFDWAATALADEDILHEALEKSLADGANPSSVHAAGLGARHAFEDARARCAAVLGVKPENVIFTSGGTESDQIPILALLRRPQKGSILISAIEHPAVSAQAELMKNCGWRVITVPCNQDGIVTPEAVIARIEDDTALVCIMAVNNETGAIQPVYEIADAMTAHCRGKRRPKFHVDAVQAAGKIPFELSYPGIDTAAISAHKLCGPRGIGILYMKDRFEPFLKGGGQESGMRSGTENLFGALALASCLERYYMCGRQGANVATNASGADGLMAQETARTACFIEKLKTLPYCTLIPESRNPVDGRFAPGVVQASFANIPGEVMVRALSEKGFFISTGSACSARKSQRPVLAAMGIKGEKSANAVRFSFSSHSTDAGVDMLFAAVSEVAGRFN